jgi:hypothetical protein
VPSVNHTGLHLYQASVEHLANAQQVMICEEDAVYSPYYDVLAIPYCAHPTLLYSTLLYSTTPLNPAGTLQVMIRNAADIHFHALKYESAGGSPTPGKDVPASGGLVRVIHSRNVSIFGGSGNYGIMNASRAQSILRTDWYAPSYAPCPHTLCPLTQHATPCHIMPCHALASAQHKTVFFF